MRDPLSNHPPLPPRAAAILAAALCLVVLALTSTGGATAAPTPHPLKACSTYSKEHFHGVTAHLPDGTKCPQSGEYCSHGPGYARAYREYGFKCESDGRLEEI
jgi:hypothetical protein